MYMRISWGAQLAAGIMLFAISFYIESQVLTTYLGAPLLAMTLAAGLELSKVLSIVLYRVIKSRRGTESYPLSVAGTTLAFRFTLLSLSVLCSTMYLAAQLDRPNLDAVRRSDLERIETEYREGVRAAAARLRSERDTTLAAVRERYGRLAEAARGDFRPVIDRLEGALSREMDNTVKGIFKGPRYRELERRLKEEKQSLARRLETLAGEERRETQQALAELAARQGATMTAARQKREQDREAVLTATYKDDSRAAHPMIASFLAVSGAVLGAAVDNLVFVFAFAVFIAVLIELGILVSFEVLTLSHLPVFDAEHRVHIHLQRKRAETKGDLDAFRMDDALRQNKTRAKVDNILRGLDPDRTRPAA